MEQHNDLDSLRQSINAIDHELITLLSSRMTLAKKVGDLKTQQQDSGKKTYLRPSREAHVIRRAIEANQHQYPPQAIYSIWRSIMSSCVHNEQALHLIVYTPEGHEDMVHIAKQYFGDFPELTCTSDIQDLLERIQLNPTMIGILPWQFSDYWWRSLAHMTAQSIFIFASLPFVSAQEAPQGLALGTIDLEPSQADTTLWLVKRQDNISADDVITRCATQDISLTHLADHLDDSLFHVDGFWPDMAHPHMQQLTAKLSDMVTRVIPLGSYPTPLHIETLKG